MTSSTPTNGGGPEPALALAALSLADGVLDGGGGDPTAPPPQELPAVGARVRCQGLAGAAAAGLNSCLGRVESHGGARAKVRMDGAGGRVVRTMKPENLVVTVGPLDMLEYLPDVFEAEVLRRLDPADRAVLAQVGQIFLIAVATAGSDLPWGGKSAGVPLKLKEFCGSVARLAWAKANGCPWGEERICAYVAMGGKLKVLIWAREHGCPWEWTTCSAAAEGGHLEVLKWARGVRHCPWNSVTCQDAAAHGHLEVLQWARELHCPWNSWTTKRAAEGGHLEVLKWARTNGCRWDRRACAGAARYGHLEVLKWARAQGCPWDHLTCSFAVRGGHMEVLTWARAHGCEWDGMTCAYAAQEANLEILQWAREHDCPWDSRTRALAAPEVLWWLDEHGAP